MITFLRPVILSWTSPINKIARFLPRLAWLFHQSLEMGRDNIEEGICMQSETVPSFWEIRLINICLGDLSFTNLSILLPKSSCWAFCRRNCPQRNHNSSLSILLPFLRIQFLRMVEPVPLSGFLKSEGMEVYRVLFVGLLVVTKIPLLQALIFSLDLPSNFKNNPIWFRQELYFIIDKKTLYSKA